MNITTCPNCKYENPPGRLSCRKCGGAMLAPRQEPKLPRCGDCGRVMGEKTTVTNTPFGQMRQTRSYCYACGLYD